MARISRLAIAVVVGVLALVPYRAPQAAAGAGPSIDQFLMPGTPTEVVAARKAERIAWTAYEHGLRNVYTAAAPEFAPVRLTNVAKDDGVELSDLSLSDDGSVVTFVRGTQPNREGWVANPTANPVSAERTIWATRTPGGGAWKLGEGTTPALSPDGRTVAYAKDGQIYRYEVRLKPDTTGTGATQYLQSRPDVDAIRVGIWGLSHGGVLTAPALARNSDIFKVGVDLAGVHLWGHGRRTLTIAECG